MSSTTPLQKIARDLYKIGPYLGLPRTKLAKTLANNNGIYCLDEINFKILASNKKNNTTLYAFAHSVISRIHQYDPTHSIAGRLRLLDDIDRCYAETQEILGSICKIDCKISMFAWMHDRHVNYKNAIGPRESLSDIDIKAKIEMIEDPDMISKPWSERYYRVAAKQIHNIFRANTSNNDFAEWINRYIGAFSKNSRKWYCNAIRAGHANGDFSINDETLIRIINMLTPLPTDCAPPLNIHFTEPAYPIIPLPVASSRKKVRLHELAG